MHLPIGYDDFGKIVDKKLDFVDKSLFIKDVLDDEATEISLIVRPRRFGKTLNLSILHYFLAAEVYGRQTAGMFDNLKIWQAGEAYRQQQGQWPVIAITFKDIKERTYELACDKLRVLLASAYKQHDALRGSAKLSDDDHAFYRAVASGAASQAQLENALLALTELIFKHHGKKPWLLIDEYDTPLQSGYVDGYYDGMVRLMRGLFSAALKNNPYLQRAVLTGILRVAKESLFSGLNNLKVYSLLHPKHSAHFGFTEEEVGQLLQQAGLESKAAEIRSWYNGYLFGNTVIYNPWSLVNCIDENGKTCAYWLNTSDNKLVRDLLVQAQPEFKERLERLLRGEELARTVDENVVFGDLAGNEGAVWSLLLMSGYLKAVRTEDTDQGKLCCLEIPNREVRMMYRQTFERWLSDGHSIDWYNEFLESLLTGNMVKFKERLQQILLETASCHDLAREPEAFYHGLMLGLTASLYNRYETKSNRESGHGRYDFVAIPKDLSKLGIVIEFKKLPMTKGEKNLDEETLQTKLDELAQAALQQIAQQHYLAEFKQRGIKEVLQIGIAYSGKRFGLRYVR